MLAIKKLRLIYLNALLSIMLFLPNTSFAELTVKDYYFLKGNTERIDDYVSGLTRGVFWANVMNATKGKPKLFCPPPKQAMEDKAALSMVDAEIRAPSRNTPWESDTPIGLVVVFAFMNKYPC